MRITAPESLRVKRVETQQALKPDAATQLVQQTDRERAAKSLYHVDWDEPLLYHLVLNTEQPAVSEGARIIREALQSQRFQATSGSLRESGT